MALKAYIISSLALIGCALGYPRPTSNITTLESTPPLPFLVPYPMPTIGFRDGPGDEDDEGEDMSHGPLWPTYRLPPHVAPVIHPSDLPPSFMPPTPLPTPMPPPSCEDDEDVFEFRSR
ncbi:hypothetical protein VMCG_03787 [Cytospora schulzeri]|uniref:Spondin domain-containing protein n=1 Tax=Cytospora schulzeri TaxID=448051 RepID=A0A423WV12_9PEZI|nr:hypothetical protein VMCG_03787 [Valsa malicola]